MKLDASTPEVHPAGTLHWGSARQLPILHGVFIASEQIDPRGVRELYWHLNANELSYVLAGEGRDERRQLGCYFKDSFHCTDGSTRNARAAE